MPPWRVDGVAAMGEKTERPVRRFVRRLGIQTGKFDDWRPLYGKANEYNRLVFRDRWIEARERETIVAVNPNTVYRVLGAAGMLDRRNRGPDEKRTGFHQPIAPHQHWHTDISCLNYGGTFCCLCSVLDGYSRAILPWEIRESMKESEVELVVQRAREKYPRARPRIISDNGPQFIARDFQTFIREAGMTHVVRSSHCYAQSNGKIERWRQTLEVETIRPRCPATKEEAERRVEKHVKHYNEVRPRSTIGYITPADKLALARREGEIRAERDRWLAVAREARRQRRFCA